MSAASAGSGERGGPRRRLVPHGPVAEGSEKIGGSARFPCLGCVRWTARARRSTVGVEGEGMHVRLRIG